MNDDIEILNAYINSLEAEVEDLKFQLHLYKMQLSFYEHVCILKSRDNDKADYITENETVKGQNE